MNRQELEDLRDSYKSGDKVKIVKNSWHRPNTIGKNGIILNNDSDQFTPNIKVMVEGFKFSHTFSPDDVEKDHE